MPAAPKLKLGDEVEYVDADGRVFEGRVVEVSNPPTIVNVEYVVPRPLVQKAVPPLSPNQKKGPGWRLRASAARDQKRGVVGGLVK